MTKKLTPELLARIKAMAPKYRPIPLRQFHDPPKARQDKNLTEPKDSKWRHQDEAVEAFLLVKGGVLEMATGTGKTRTALRILTRLHRIEAINGAIVCTDGTDLLDQWCQEIEEWTLALGMPYRTLKHYGTHHRGGEFVLSPRESILVISRGQLHMTLSRLPNEVTGRLLIVHDEVHGLGAPGCRENLAGKHAAFGYRLGLTATPEREYDEEGTKFLFEELAGPGVDEPFFRFGLEDAIRRGILCEFDYVPLEYRLTQEDRKALQAVYKKQAARNHAGNPMTKEELWIELSKVYKRAAHKPIVFADYVAKCPNILQSTIVFVEDREFGERLYDTIHRQTYRFSQYYADDKPRTLLRFADGELDCLITCHKLSQGIDIRGLRNVVLFSSSRPKLETIQRIGRCLRTNPEEPDKRARVVDFVRVVESEQDFDNADQQRKEWLEKLSAIRRNSNADSQ